MHISLIIRSFTWFLLLQIAARLEMCGKELLFIKYILKSPSVISFYSISLLIYWSDLQKKAEKGVLIEGGKQVEANSYQRLLPPAS
jgi:hypothetical protein